MRQLKDQEQGSKQQISGLFGGNDPCFLPSK